MKITNNFGAPAPLVTLASKSYYTKGKAQFSVTELISPPRIRRLREKHDEELKQDVTDLLWSLLGSALHVVAERGETPGWTVEERLFTTIDGQTISGQIDAQEETPEGIVIWDYKFTSSFAVMSDKVDWEEQLNLYALLARLNGKKIAGLKIVALIRDWSRHKAKSENYPASQIHVVEIPLWDQDTQMKFITERLDIHQDAHMDFEIKGELPECSEQERWQTETTYAVKRENRKTAIRVLTDFNQAVELANKEKGYVETRLGEPKRCTGNYCGVAEFCDQYRTYRAHAAQDEREQSHGEEA